MSALRSIPEAALIFIFISNHADQCAFTLVRDEKVPYSSDNQLVGVFSFHSLPDY